MAHVFDVASTNRMILELPPAHRPTELKALDAAYLAAWNRHDACAVAAAFEADGVCFGPHIEAGLRGAAQIRAHAQRVFSIYADFRVDLERIAGAGADRLSKQVVFSGRWVGRFPGGHLADLVPTGRAFAVRAVEILEYKRTRIAKSWVYFDRLSLLTQVGAWHGAAPRPASMLLPAAQQARVGSGS